MGAVVTALIALRNPYLNCAQSIVPAHLFLRQARRLMGSGFCPSGHGGWTDAVTGGDLRPGLAIGACATDLDALALRQIPDDDER